MVFPSHYSCQQTTKRNDLDYVLIRLTKLAIIMFISFIDDMVICINARLMCYNCNIASLQCGPTRTRRKESSGWEAGLVSSTRCDLWALLTLTRERQMWSVNGLMVMVRRGRQTTFNIQQKGTPLTNRMAWEYSGNMNCMDWCRWFRGRQGILNLKHRMLTRHTSPNPTKLTSIDSNMNDETILSL